MNISMIQRFLLAGVVLSSFLLLGLAAQDALDDELEELMDEALEEDGKKDDVFPNLSDELLNDAKKEFETRALSRVDLVESDELRRIREKEPEPGPGKLIYKDDFESYEEGATPKFWQNVSKILTVDTPGNKSKVMRCGGGPGHSYMAREIHATNFRLKYDFLCGGGGEVTWLGRLHGERGHSLWSNENYYQINFYTSADGPLGFGVNHLWVGGGYPFENAKQPGVGIPQPAYRLSWHTAEVIMDDDRIILKLNGVRVLDGHYPILMARTRKDFEYGFGTIMRDSHSSPPSAKWVHYDWFDNVEIYDLETPVRERRWPARLHVAPWGSDDNSGTDPAHPWKSLKKAFSMLRRGDRLTIQEGTYDEAAQWLDPPLCDLPNADDSLADYPTIIRASFAEEVKISKAWTLRNPGDVHIERLSFSGRDSRLTVEGNTGTKPTLLKRLDFRDGSGGLELNLSEGSEVVCGRTMFVDCSSALSVDGMGRVDVVRSVFDSSAFSVADTARPATKFVHCTGIGTTAFPKGSINCLSIASQKKAAEELVDPRGGRFDPKEGSGCVDAGIPGRESEIPAFARMSVVKRPDLGAFEYYSPRQLTCAVPEAEICELTGEMLEGLTPSKCHGILAKELLKLRPGDTLSVGPGLWSEDGLGLNNLRGEPYAPIRIVGKPALGAIIHGGVRFGNCDQLYLKGFCIAGYKGVKPNQAGSCLGWDKCGRTWVVECEITEAGHTGVGGAEQGVTLLRNWIHHNGVGGLNHGLYWAGNGPAWVIGNTFHGNSGWGFHNHAAVYNGWQGWKYIVHHNLFIGPEGGVVTTGSRGEYYNNTFIRSGNGAFWFYNDGHRDNKIINNIIFETTNGVHTRDGNVMSHNLITNLKTFQGDNPVNGDPFFVDPKNHDYRLKPGSPAIDAGINVGLDDNEHPTLGAYDGHEEWAPPKPLPEYQPAELKKLLKQMKQTLPEKEIPLNE